MKLIQYLYIFPSFIFSMPSLSMDESLHLLRHRLVEVFNVFLCGSPPNVACKFLSPIVFVHWLITFELLVLATSDSAHIVENSKGSTNLIRFWVQKVEIWSKCGKRKCIFNFFLISKVWVVTSFSYNFWIIGASIGAKITENSKGITNLIGFSRFRVWKVEIGCFEGDAYCIVLYFMLNSAITHFYNKVASELYACTGSLTFHGYVYINQCHRGLSK